MREAGEGKIPVERETVTGRLERWLDHTEARGRAPKTLLENRRMAAIINEELGAKEIGQLRGRDIDSLYDELRSRGPGMPQKGRALLSHLLG